MSRTNIALVTLLCSVVAAVALTQVVTTSDAGAAGTPLFSATDPLTFDFVTVGHTSATKVETVTNIGTAPLTFSQVLLDGRDAKDFEVVSDSCTGSSLAPKATCGVGLAFRPTTAGTRSAWIRFTDNSPCHNWINLAGSGVTTPIPTIARTATCEPGVGGTTTVTTAQPIGSPPVGSALVGASSVISLSSGCSSRRTVTVHLAAPKGDTFALVKFLLHGKTIKTSKGSSIRTKISLRGLPRGRFTLEVRATTLSGRHFSRRHHYVTCVSNKS